MEDYNKHTLTDLVIATLCSCRSTRIFHQILRERTEARYKRASVDSTVSRLIKNKLVEKTSTGWKLTDKGHLAQQKNRFLDYIQSPFKKDSPKNTLVAFDIPEKNRLKRTWVRNQLKIFNYTMMQRSLWLGPGPLPKEFTKRLNSLKIKEYVKTFEILPKDSHI